MATNPLDEYINEPSEAIDFSVLDEFSNNPAKNEVEAEIASGEWTSEDSLAGALIFLEGATLGWSDEIGVGLASLALAATSDETQEESYARLKREYDAMQAGFSERNPLAAAGLEAAGAIVSPISKVGMGIKGAKTITGLIGRAGVEGAIYGAGKTETGADSEQIGRDAIFGLGTGIATGAAFAAPTWLLKKKIQAPLDTEEGFKPITLAANTEKTSENIMQSFYRDVVGPSFGATGVVRAQEEKFYQAAAKEAKEATTALKGALSKADDELKQKIKGAEAENKAAVEVIEGNYSSLLNKDTGNVIARKTAQLKENLDSNQDMFRLQAFRQSLPASIKKRDVVDILESTDPNSAMQKLEKQWSNVGFESIKTRSYQVNPKAVATEMSKRLEGDARVRLAVESSGQLRNTIENVVGLLAEKTTQGRISGEDLSDLRSSFGTAAAAKSDAGGSAAIQNYVLRDMQSVLDNVVTKTLSGDRLAKFEADRAAWATHSILKDAVAKASTKVGKQGRFTPDEWLQAAKTNSPRQARQGTTPLQKEANRVGQTIQKQEKTIIDASISLAEKLGARRDRELKKLANKSMLKKTELQKQQSMLKNGLRKNPENAEAIASNQLEIDNLEQVVAQTAEELNKIEKLRTPENPGWFHRFAASGLIGTLTTVATQGNVLTGLGNAVSTIGASKALSTPSAQRFLAGQTPLQQAAQQAKFMGSEALGTAPLAGARAVTGMLTGI